jgi:tetratricopeptide (TPR) repeat protein
VWGVLESGLLAAFFPDSDAGDGLKIAERLQQQFSTHCPRTLTAGVADFPLLNYARGDILGNALKAIDHAAFFGPGSRVAFDAVSLNVSADRYYARGDHSGAVRELTMALALDPGNVNVHNSLGVCYGESGHLEKAQAEFEAAVRLDAREAMAVFNLGQVAWQRGERNQALERFRSAQRLDPQRFEVPLAIGRLHLEGAAPELARDFLEQACALNDQSALAQRVLGECYERLGMKELAVSAYRRAVRLRPNDAESLSALGALYDSLGENREIALLFCRQSVAIAPDNGLCQLRLGRVLAGQGCLDEALQALRQAEALGQADAVAAAAQVAAALAAAQAG